MPGCTRKILTNGCHAGLPTPRLHDQYMLLFWACELDPDLFMIRVRQATTCEKHTAAHLLDCTWDAHLAEPGILKWIWHCLWWFVSSPFDTHIKLSFNLQVNCCYYLI